MKWFIVFAVVVLVGLVVYQQRTSVKTAYVNGLPQYTHLPGREYIFEHDCYIFKLDARKTAYPLVGSRMTVPELPAEVSEKNVGAVLPGVRILDVARVGDRFRIVSVRRDTSRRGTSFTFEILFTNEGERKYPRLDAFYILDHEPEKRAEAPRVIEAYAVPRVKI
jgi:hypothetical protein